MRLPKRHRRWHGQRLPCLLHRHGKERRTLSSQVFCYALSPPDGSEWRQRIEAEVEHFLDVSARSVSEIAAQISARTLNALMSSLMPPAESHCQGAAESVLTGCVAVAHGSTLREKAPACESSSALRHGGHRRQLHGRNWSQRDQQLWHCCTGATAYSTSGSPCSGHAAARFLSDNERSSSLPSDR